MNLFPSWHVFFLLCLCLEKFGSPRGAIRLFQGRRMIPDFAPKEFRWSVTHCTGIAEGRPWPTLYLVRIERAIRKTFVSSAILKSNSRDGRWEDELRKETRGQCFQCARRGMHLLLGIFGGQLFFWLKKTRKGGRQIMLKSPNFSASIIMDSSEVEGDLEYRECTGRDL